MSTSRKSYGTRNADGTWNTKTGCPPYSFWTEQAKRWNKLGSSHSGKKLCSGTQQKSTDDVKLKHGAELQKSTPNV